MSAAPQKPSGAPSQGNPNQAQAAAAAAARELADQGAVAPAGGENDEQLARAWGFTERRPRMSREAVIGLLAVIALVALFGYVAWNKKFGKRTSVVAKIDSEVKDPESTDDSDSTVEKIEFSKKKSSDISLDELNFGLDDPDPEPEPKKPKREILDDTLDVSDSQSEPTMNEPSDDDPFSGKLPKKRAAIDLDEMEEDTLPRQREPERLKRPDLLAEDEEFKEPVRVTVTPQKTRKPARLPDVDQFADNSQTTIDGPSPTTDLPPTKTSGRNRLVHEDEYLIESGDNFCVVSKKLYGTGRYFLALAEANKNRVADPCRMRPGLIISAPPRETLERQFAELIPETRRTADAESDKDNAEAPKAAKRPSATAQAPGLFRDANGVIWYRVGEGDTLSEIAQSYLDRMSRAEQIVNLNRDRLPDPNNLKIGQVLKMPSDASPVRLVETDRDIR